MQLIQNGPDIPDRLLQAHEEGRVVFFCGAGISFPAGLPSFRGLVEKIYAGLGTSPNEVEQQAIKQGQLDTAIGLLEGRVVGGRESVRKKVAEILTPAYLPPSAIATHQALITLSKNREGRYRLITTNFDRIFEHVISGMNIPSAAAPRLPVPKLRWSGLVYLHGLLAETPTAHDLDTLVLSSGDFGLAYLAEGWAARFVSELVRNYVVCFIGYSINDAVLRYMMDALAADRLLGEAPVDVFAFGQFSKGKEDEQRREWSAKNVTPILYRARKNHFYLQRTLQVWAQHYRDGVLGNERVISRYASNPPPGSTTQDDIVGRVLWALSDPTGLPAKRFAEISPAPSIEWLGPLSDDRFGHHDLRRFRIQPTPKEDKNLRFSLLSRFSKYDASRSMYLVTDGRQPHVWDQVMQHLARWIVRHLDSPRLFLWFCSHGARLDNVLARMISDALKSSTVHLSPAMRTLWSILLAGRVR